MNINKEVLTETNIKQNRPKQPVWQNAIHTVGTTFLLVIVNFIFSAMLARILGPAGKGSYELVLTSATLFSTFLSLSLPSGITYVFAKERLIPKRIIMFFVFLTIIQGACAAFILLVTRDSLISELLLPQTKNQEHLLILLLLITALISTAYWRAMIIGRQRIIQMNVIDLITQSSLVALVLIMVWNRNTQHTMVSPELFLWFNIGINIIVGVLFLYFLRKDVSSGPIGTHLVSITKFAIPSFTANMIQFFNYRIGVFIISFFLGLSAVGLYTLALTLSQFLWLFSQAIARVLLPSVASVQEDKVGNTYRTVQATRISLWVTALMALMLGFTAHLFIPLIYGSDFNKSVNPFLFMLPGVVLFSISNVLGAYIAGIGKPKINLLASFLGLVAIIPFSFWFIPRMGINGAAIASSISYITSTIVLVAAFVRLTGTSFTKVFVLSLDDWELCRSLIPHRKA